MRGSRGVSSSARSSPARRFLSLLGRELSLFLARSRRRLSAGEGPKISADWVVLLTGPVSRR